MKRGLLILMFLVFVMVGCSLPDAAQDTTSNVANKESDSVIVTAEQLDCTIYPIVGTTSADALCQFEVEDPALKKGERNIFYANGRLQLSEDKFTFKSAESFDGSGIATFTSCPESDVFKNGLFYPCGLPYLKLGDIKELFTQLDMPDATAEMVAVVISPENGTGDSIALSEGTEMGNDFTVTGCEGIIVTGPELAQVVVWGVQKDGQEVRGSGFLMPSLKEGQPGDEFACSGEGNGRYGFQAEIQGIPVSQTSLGNFEIQDIRLTDNSGNSFLMDLGTGFGFWTE